MDITVENLQKKIPLNPPQIIRIVKTILQREGVDKAYLAVVFVTSQKIMALNKKFLGRKYSTDVLAFDLRGTENLPRENKKKPSQEMMGDIIISTDAALRNAKEFKTPLPQEVVLYVIHGILHLLGYDDHSEQDRKKMRAKEQEVLKFLGNKIDSVLK